ncbi:hypothetical protein [Achromobacter ruhlandii]|nr:hypothetical protein [Achromobacter ruhlandii]
MTNQNNAAQAAEPQTVLSFDERERILCQFMREPINHDREMAIAIESAALSKLRAPVADEQQAVAYLDLGAGGYVDVGTDLTDEQLATLPKGRHMLAIIGTHGVDGYTRAALASAPVADERISLLGAANLAFNALHECKPAKGAEKQYSDAIQALQSALHDIAYTVNRTATPQQFADHLQREARAALASASVADESPMAKVAEALREKARQEQQAYQDRRAQATEWGPMPTGTQADDPSELGALADGLESAPVAGKARRLPTINVGGKERPQQWFTAKEVRQLLDAASQASEPVYAYRRKGLDDFVTCDRERFDELSAKPHLFETRIFYAAPQQADKDDEHGE